jgi:hypothetical protein
MAAEYRMTLAPQTLENAAPDARAVLEQAKAQVGFSPTCTPAWSNRRAC